MVQKKLKPPEIAGVSAIFIPSTKVNRGKNPEPLGIAGVSGLFGVGFARNKYMLSKRKRKRSTVYLAAYHMTPERERSIDTFSNIRAMLHSSCIVNQPEILKRNGGVP